MKHIDVGVIAMGSTPWAIDENYQRFEKYVREAAARRAGLIIAPEAALDGYAYVVDPDTTKKRMLDIAQTVPDGRYIKRACALAHELGIFLCFGFLERENDDLYNASILIDHEGDIVARYRKVHPDIESFITPGRELKPTKTALGNVGMLICSDRNTVDNFGTLGAQGVEIVLLPMNGSGGPEQVAVLRQRARDNCCAIVVANSWSSTIIGPYGEIYLDKVEIECVSVGRLYTYHRPRGKERDQFVGRRPDLYGPLTKNAEPEPMFDEQGNPTEMTLKMRRDHLAKLKAEG